MIKYWQRWGYYPTALQAARARRQSKLWAGNSQITAQKGVSMYPSAHVEDPEQDLEEEGWDDAEDDDDELSDVDDDDLDLDDYDDLDEDADL